MRSSGISVARRTSDHDGAGMEETIDDERRMHAGDLIDEVDGFTVINCESCGFAHIVPIPTTDELVSVYRDDYYTREKPLYLERHAEDADWWKRTYGERYELFERHLPEGRRRILDVGSGPGYFLLTGQERGWQAQGIEPSIRAAEHARELGVPVVNGFFGEETAPGLGTFDVVHMSEVLEHIPDPRALVATAASVIEPGGLLYVMVPNEYSPFQKVLRETCGFEPWWLAPPHHINYFDLDSLARLLESQGLEVVEREATFPIDIFLLMGQDYVGNDETGRRCHAMRKSFEENLWKAGQADFKSKLYKSFAELGLGRLVAVLGRKPD